MRDPFEVRRDSKCPAKDFRHRLRVGVVVALLILILHQSGV